jgi:hypothetical protein
MLAVYFSDKGNKSKFPLLSTKLVNGKLWEKVLAWAIVFWYLIPMGIVSLPLAVTFSPVMICLLVVATVPVAVLYMFTKAVATWSIQHIECKNHEELSKDYKDLIKSCSKNNFLAKPEV